MAFIDYADKVITGGKEQKATDDASNAIRAFGDLDLPRFQELDPEQYKWLADFDPTLVDAGADIDPRLADFIAQQDSNMNNVSVDPRLKDQQMATMSALDDIINSGGMTLSDRAAMNEIQGQVGAEDRGRREAIKQNMAMRGMGGSGMELLQMLDSGQAATDRSSQAGMDTAAMAQQRALDAILAQGSMAGNIRGQDFGEQSQIAQAQDAINQFNASNQNAMNQYNAGTQNNMAMYNRDTGLNAQMYNADAQNTAGMYNNQGRQGLSNANVDNTNNAQMHNRFTIPQQQYENAYNKASGESGAHTSKSQLQDKQANRRVEGFKSGVSSTMQGIAASDERVKHDIGEIEKADVIEFFKAINPKSYHYNDPEHPAQAPGERLGFMLQDVENTKLGQRLIQRDRNGFMMYDRDNLQGIVMAGLSILAKEVA